MYAQARPQPVYRHSAKQTSAFEHVQKCTRGCSFSNEPCDCIKSLKLGDKTVPRLIQKKDLKSA